MYHTPSPWYTPRTKTQKYAQEQAAAAWCTNKSARAALPKTPFSWTLASCDQGMFVRRGVSNKHKGSELCYTSEDWFVLYVWRLILLALVSWPIVLVLIDFSASYFCSVFFCFLTLYRKWYWCVFTSEASSLIFTCAAALYSSTRGNTTRRWINLWTAFCCGDVWSISTCGGSSAMSRG